MNVPENKILDVLKTYKKFVVYGLSPDSTKPSQRVPLFMKSKGYDVVGIYRKIKEVNGLRIFSSLAEVPADYRKFVNVFRRSESIPEIVEEVIAVGGVEVLWLQLGIVNPEAERKAEAAGIKVVSDRCLHIEYEKYFR